MPPGKFDSDDAPMSDVDDVAPENGGQTVRGDRNQIVGRVDGSGNIIAGTVVMQPEPQEKRPRLERQLLTQVENEVKDRLRQSLHNQVFIELGKQQAPEQVSRPWDAEVKIGNREPEPIPEGQSILDVFYREDIAGKLLILGHPGAGKTTTLVELANALVSQAWQDIDLPIPVLFNLSGWRDDKQTIAQWLVKELKAKYGVREKIGQELLDENKLLPLLDGLDELAPQRQEPCAKAINIWQQSEQRANQVVVCSRLQEYETYATVLELNGAICLQPLQPEQIEEYFQQTGKLEIWNVVGQEKDLLELVSIPLWLSVLSLAYRDLEPRCWKQLETSQERLTMLLDAYVGSRLSDKQQSNFYKNKIPTFQQTRRWLVWLAQNMDQDEFLIEQLQPKLLTSQKDIRTMCLSGYLIRGLNAGIVFYLVSFIFEYVLQNTALEILTVVEIISLLSITFIFSLFSGLIGVLIGLIRLLFKRWDPIVLGSIKNVESLKIDFSKDFCKIILKSSKIGWKSGFEKGTSYGQFFGIIASFYVVLIAVIDFLVGRSITSLHSIALFGAFGIFTGLFPPGATTFSNFISGILVMIYVIIGIFYILFFFKAFYGLLGSSLGGFIGLAGGFSNGIVDIFKSDIETKIRPNQGVFNSGKSSVILVILFSVLWLGTSSFLRFLFLFTNIDIYAPIFWNIFDTLISFLIFIGSILLWMICIYGGAETYFRHYVLRFVLARSGKIPYLYANFLNYCTERLLLQRVGGRFRFLHRTLQEHFAAMPLEDYRQGMKP